MSDNSNSNVNNETQLFWAVVSELRQAKTDKLSDNAILALLEELETIALNTTIPTLAARCHAEIAKFGEEATTPVATPLALA